MSPSDDCQPLPLNYATALPRRSVALLGRTAWVCIWLQGLACLVAFGWSDLAVEAVRKDVPESILWGPNIRQYVSQCIYGPAIFGAITIVVLSALGIISARPRGCGPARLLGFGLFTLAVIGFMSIGLIFLGSTLYP